MNPMIYDIFSAVLAGGLAGQLTTLFMNRRYQSRRDEEIWIRQERYKLFCEILDITSSAVTRQEETDLRTWPDEIRITSQKIQLLYPFGEPPEAVTQLLEELFQLALSAKLSIKNPTTDTNKKLKECRQQIRIKTRELRKMLSTTLIKYTKK